MAAILAEMAFLHKPLSGKSECAILSFICYILQTRVKHNLEAWIIQFCAYHMVETPNKANPFLIEMLKYGLNEAKAEVVTP
jgi:hypothetical protein